MSLCILNFYAPLIENEFTIKFYPDFLHSRPCTTTTPKKHSLKQLIITQEKGMNFTISLSTGGVETSNKFT